MKCNKDRGFVCVLSLVLITLPFPKYSLNSQAIVVLFIYWLFYNSFYDKLMILRVNLKQFVCLSSLFFLAIMGLLYTSDFEQALTNLKIPFLIFPLVFLSIKPFSFKLVNYLLDLFTIATILAALYGLLKALWLKSNNLGEYFYYLDFAKVLDKHTTYFSLFICISLINLIYHFLEKSLRIKSLYVIGMAFLLLILYMLSSKISLIALFFVLIFSIYIDFRERNLKSKGKLVLKGVLLFLIPMLFWTPNLKSRLLSEKASNLSERFLLWEAVTHSYLNNSVIYGAGTGDGHKGLAKSYSQFDYDIAAKEAYNAHNQYLEQLLYFGFIGLIILVSLLSCVLYISFLKKNYLFFYIFLCFSFFMLSESILERQSGLVLFSLIICLFISASNGIPKKTEGKFSGDLY